jgi:DNA-binding Lrp family transcriptional regulator
LGFSFLKYLYDEQNTAFSDMKIEMNDLERDILNAIQHGVPMSLSPYQDIAKDIGISVDRLFEVLRKWTSEKKIRRVGAIVNHFQIGHGSGAMVVWNVPEDRIDEVGKLFASLPKVSHAYQRPVQRHWSYNLYTMVHASDNEELEMTLEDMSHKSGICDWRALKTVRELKKVPPTYIIDD